MKNKYSALLFAFADFGRKFSKIISQKAKNKGITPSQMIIICILGREGAMIPKEISDATMIDKTAISRDTKSLLERGFIQKGQRGSTMVYKMPLELSPEGREIFDKIKCYLGSVGEEIFSDIDPDTLKEIDRAIKKADTALTELGNRNQEP